MEIMNTSLEQPKRRLYTWTSPDRKHRNQIDYILINKRWKSTIRDTCENKARCRLRNRSRTIGSNIENETEETKKIREIE